MNLLAINQPARYFNKEVNSICRSSAMRVALAFPDTYEIGMSHIGLKILYDLINSLPSVSAERVYAPWIDYELYLRKNNQPLTSLESKSPLICFNIVGFSLQYELSYTNVLTMLNLGGIPLRGKERVQRRCIPLVIAGGPCVMNPGPMEDFIDAFVIGDGEDVIKEVIEVYQTWKEQRSAKEELLKALSLLNGVYVPLMKGEEPVKRRFVDDLNAAPFPTKLVVPYMPIVHDRVAVEVSRGCTRGCRFCQAGIMYRPLRQRSPEAVIELAENALALTGYDEVSFTSLSIGDYPELYKLLDIFNQRNAHRHIAVSLPSLRVGAVDSRIVKKIKSVRKTGFTIAPEAGTERLREVINKDFTEAEYNEALTVLFHEGWHTIKLYFMIGLPTETDDDLEGIREMVLLALSKGKKETGRRVEINVGISAFVPKPHTPFQWCGQTPFDELRRKQKKLKNMLRKKGINLKDQNLETSLLEGVFSRGDCSLSPVIEKAWIKGCRFDGWSETLNFSKWHEAMNEHGIDPHAYAERSFDCGCGVPLPWDIIDSGISQDFLIREYQKALNQELTPDCANACHGCGLTCKKTSSQNPDKNMRTPHVRDMMVKEFPQKIRLMYSKTGILRFLSHRQTMTVFERAIRRADIAIEYSRGFHPHPKLSFGTALPMGVEGLRECFDMEILAPNISVDYTKEIQKNLNSTLPQGVEIIRVRKVEGKVISLNDFISRYVYEISNCAPYVSAIEDFMVSASSFVLRKGKTIDIRPMVEEAYLKDSTLFLTVTDKENISVRLFEILEKLLGLPLDAVQSLHIKRTHLFGFTKEGWKEVL
jgi:radical SAM family uncharacterized protein/radical SAM-linked protein